MTWRDFTIITLTDGRKEVYLIGGILNDGTVRLFKKDYYSTDDPGDITVPQELVDRNSMVFQPVQKTKWWYQIFYRGYGYLIKKNGRPRRAECNGYSSRQAEFTKTFKISCFNLVP